jgi:ABC-type multidrug transport system fused ATPase/permease subunit
MNLRSLFHFAAAYRSQLIVLVALTMLSSLVMLVIPWLAGRMLGGIMLRKASANDLMGLLLAALVILAALAAITSYLSRATAMRLLADLRVRIYAHLQDLPLGFHHDRRQGDLLALGTFEVARLGQFLTGTLVSLPSRVLTTVGAVILMYRIDPNLALLVPALIPAFYLILKIVGRRLRWLAVSAQQAEADVIATMERNLAMLQAIKSFAREAAQTEDYRYQVDRSLRILIQEARINAVLEPLVGLIAASGAVLLLYTAGQNVKTGAMTGVELFSFRFFAALLTRPVGALAHIYGEVQSARGTLERLQSVLREEVEPGYTGTNALHGARGDLSFAGVSFSYPGRDQVLSDVNLHIRAGEKVALIGGNGAGKTTLVNLLLRFCDPDQGTIQLDGQDIGQIQVQDLRRRIGLVPQRAALFNDTIRANIAFGLDHAEHDQIVAAARLAQAHDFISALPKGYDTQIGDHGVRLSGGQQQRLSLARALVKDPPILVFDEATSMFDLEGERAFIEASAQALEGRTVILITHRPASLAIADRIISVERGAVREVAGGSQSAVAAAIR